MAVLILFRTWALNGWSTFLNRTSVWREQNKQTKKKGGGCGGTVFEVQVVLETVMDEKYDRDLK